MKICLPSQDHCKKKHYIAVAVPWRVTGIFDPFILMVSKQIRSTTRPCRHHRLVTSEQTENGRAVLSFIKGVADRIGCILCRHQAKTTFQLTNIHFKSVKEAQDTLASGRIDMVLYSFGWIYVGTMKCSVAMRTLLTASTWKVRVANMLFEEMKILTALLQFAIWTEICCTEKQNKIYKNEFNINEIEETLRSNKTLYLLWGSQVAAEVEQQTLIGWLANLFKNQEQAQAWMYV